jgi:methionyl aminopeptidase
LLPEALRALREAGRIAAAARDLGASQMAPGVSLREVVEGVEEEIRRRGGELAFPAQTSVNHVAAHDCPSPEDERVYADGDLAKLDVGVHLDGYVVDTAVTVNMGERPEGRRLVEATRAALEAAILAAGPGVPIWRLSAAIAKTLRSFAVRPMRNLCGHHVGRWVVHCPPPVPNLPEEAEGNLAEGAVLAIEPFATEGPGRVAEMGPPEVFRLLPDREPGAGVDRPVLEALRARRGLPFSRRDLKPLPRAAVEETLRLLSERGALAAYSPLLETTGRKVAQAEHTIYLGAEGVLVLTR